MQTMTVRPPEPPRSTSEEDALQPFRITPRVLSILSAVAHFGVMTAHQIARLDGGSRQKITRILQRCSGERGLLKRVGAARDASLTSFFDTRPKPYAITAKGARCLADAGMPINARPNKTEVLLQHNIEVAEIMAFGFHAAATAHGALRLIDHHDLLPLMPAPTRQLRKPFCLHTTVRPADFPHLRRLLKEPTEIGVEPDRLFVLALENAGWSFALELDRGTENISARRLRGKATYFRKLLGYYAAWCADKHTEQWGEFAKAFRVLTVTPSDARIRNMINAQQEITRGAAAGLFLYSTPQRIAAHGALGPAWLSATRDGISLLDRE